MGVLEPPLRSEVSMTQIVQGERYRSALLPIPYFHVAVRAVALNRAIYFPVRGVSVAVGVNHRTQRAQLQLDSRFTAALRILPVETSQGMRDALCIHKKMVGAWLTQIDPHHCKHASTRALLTRFQAELFAAADRFLFGKVEMLDANVAQSLITGTLHVGPCPGCGMLLCLMLDGGVAHLTPEPEEE